MSLRHAKHRGEVVPLEGGPPYPLAALAPLRGQRFVLPTADRWVRDTGDEAHAYLDGARAGWVSHPEYMDFLDEASPVHHLKKAEADLYLHHWAPALQDSEAAILDVGCGVGRLAIPLLRRGHTVYAVDPDLEALRRLAWHAAAHEGAGALDLFWASVHHLPDVIVPVAIAAEVLCYVPEHVAALTAIADRVSPGGQVLVSVEARWGWAAAQDAPPGSLTAALEQDGDGVVHVPGDRWVRTYDEPALRDWIASAGLELESVVPSHWIPDGPLEGVAPDALSLQQLLAWEESCRSHPVWGPLHRLWLVTARKRR